MSATPPADTKAAAAKPLAFQLFVQKPSGEPIEQARVEIEWDFQNPYDEVDDVQVVHTDSKGIAAVPVLDPGEWLRDTEVTGTLRVSKRHHGPIVAEGKSFKNGAAVLRVQYETDGATRLQVLGLEPPTRVLWGRPRTLGEHKDSLEVTLMEGGTLGKEHPAVRTRRLSSAGRAATPAAPLSQIDEELLFHIAHGELAPTPRTDYEFTHDPALGDFEDCVAGRCTAKLRAPVTQPKGVAKISARAAVAGGLRVAHISNFVGSSIKLSGPGDPHNLNPRLMVGVVRVCRLLSNGAFGGLKIRTFITVGFGRANEDRAHGNGRGIDFSGASTEHTPDLEERADRSNTNPLDPNVAWPKTANGQFHVAKTIAPRQEKDFVVLFHWGMVKRLVERADGVVERRGFSDKGTYDDAFRTRHPEKMLYSLSERPAESDRAPSHKLSDTHYDQAGVLFLGIYEFFARELSHRDTDVGPLPPPPATPAPKLQDQLADDASTTVPAPGSVGGQLLHPDTPEPDLFDPSTGRLVLNASGRSKRARRHSHLNHVHANVGPMSSGDPFFER